MSKERVPTCTPSRTGKDALLLKALGIDDEAVECFAQFVAILREWDSKSRLGDV